MDFQEFWNELKVELKQEKKFRTLTQGNTFTAYFEPDKDGEPFLRIMTDNGIIRGRIPDYEFNGVWDNVKQWPNSTRLVNRGGRLESYPKKTGGIGKSMQVAYIVALIKHIVNDQKME